MLAAAWDGDGTLVLAGEGPLEIPGALSRGRCEATDLRNLYAGSDVVVVPSVPTRDFLEPWGLVVNEAFHQGVPVIATDAVGAAAGGLVRHERTGLVVPAGDAEALRARAPPPPATTPRCARRLGAAGRAAAAAYTPAAWAEGMSRALTSAKRAASVNSLMRRTIFLALLAALLFAPAARAATPTTIKILRDCATTASFRARTRSRAAQGAQRAADRRRRVLRLPRRPDARDHQGHRGVQDAHAHAHAGTDSSGGGGTSGGSGTGGGSGSSTPSATSTPDASQAEQDQAILSAPSSPQDARPSAPRPRDGERRSRPSSSSAPRTRRASPPRSDATACPRPMIAVLVLIAATLRGRAPARDPAAPCLPLPPAHVGSTSRRGAGCGSPALELPIPGGGGTILGFGVAAAIVACAFAARAARSSSARPTPRSRSCSSARPCASRRCSCRARRARPPCCAGAGCWSRSRCWRSSPACRSAGR